MNEATIVYIKNSAYEFSLQCMLKVYDILDKKTFFSDFIGDINNESRNKRIKIVTRC
jgi:hypothetical protein